MPDFKQITTNEWMSLINSEASPDLDYYKVSYLQLGDSYGVHIHSGFGSFLSRLTKDKNDVESLEKELKARYDSVKGAGTEINSMVGFSPLSSIKAFIT
jgi:primase-polymerase (primpol)-like protein